jgi:hypothetical protein
VCSVRRKLLFIGPRAKDGPVHDFYGVMGVGASKGLAMSGIFAHYSATLVRNRGHT